MNKGLREFDDRIGRCFHCNLLIFKSDNDYKLSQFDYKLCHITCDNEFMNKASQC